MQRMATSGAVTRQEARAGTAKAKRGKSKPFVFAFKAPTKTFQMRMSFRKGRVDKAEIIAALENVIRELRASK